MTGTSEINGTASPFRTTPRHKSVLTVPSSYHKLKDTQLGYTDQKFPHKDEQMEQVAKEVEASGFIPSDLAHAETRWFYNNLGIEDTYFAMESVETIVRHILALYAAKIVAYSKKKDIFEVRLEREEEPHAVYIDTSVPGVTVLSGPQYEKRIDKKYLDPSNPSKAYRLETFRSENATLPGADEQLRTYFVTRCDFVMPNPSPEDERDINKCSDRTFLRKASANTLNIYGHVVNAVLERAGPVLELFEIEGARECRLVIGYKQGSASSYFSALSDLYHYYGLTSQRKYVEQFSNGVTIISIYLRPVPGPQMARHPPIEHSIHQVLKEASLLYCIPRNTFQDFFVRGQLSLQETIYAHCVWIFVTHFLNRLGSEYSTLVSLLQSKDDVSNEILSKIKKRLRQETFTRNYILEIISTYPDLVKLLYTNFAVTHYITSETGDKFGPTLSFQRLQVTEVMSESDLENEIQRVTNDYEYVVMHAFLTFNKTVLKTNFYQPTKVALSFRLGTDFLPEIEYPTKLYGMFMVVGSEFRAFHLRFRDVARGGIRIVKSRNKESYSINVRNLFDEAYALASTQQRKNKDIPEGGAKGVILLDYEQQDRATVVFQKFIDSLLDLLLPGESPGIKDRIVDLHGKDEIIFMGPDEGTASLVDWATEHTRARGAYWWKSAMTGKSPRLGGIPHDRYGMTTRSVRAYVTGIYRKLGLKEESLTKLQTGGPDGDLGSNEILLSKERYIGIIDGSGVLYDPEGLNRDELHRLARARKTIDAYDSQKLGSNGYKVLIDDNEVILPDGEVVRNTVAFRNCFHLRVEADVFVPCGGRPESIDVNNVGQLIRNKKSKILYIVEGANLFITQDAKIRLEKAGCILFKDASANKGGVTSSSLEVLASLAFNDEEFTKNMCIDSSHMEPPEFYRAYVKEVQDIIERNATLEFEAIWQEHLSTGKPRSVISDELSTAIIKLDEELQASSLWDNLKLRTTILSESLPQTLLNELGLDTILKRVPENYIRAIWSCNIASKYVYLCGVSASPFKFFDFITKKFDSSTRINLNRSKEASMC